jgi:hypothetical protein
MSIQLIIMSEASYYRGDLPWRPEGSNSMNLDVICECIGVAGR